MDREGQGCQLGNQSSSAVSASHDKASAALPVQQPSAPSRSPPDWSVQQGTLVGNWSGCASLGCGSRSQGLKVTVWGHGWLLSELKAVHCWYFWVWCHMTSVFWQLMWCVVSCRGMRSALQGRCRGGNRGGGLPPIFAVMWPKVAGGAGEDVWRGGMCSAAGEHGQVKPWGEALAEGRAKRC